MRSFITNLSWFHYMNIRANKNRKIHIMTITIARINSVLSVNEDSAPTIKPSQPI